METLLNSICKTYKLGNVMNYELLESSQNTVYKVQTNEQIYIIKLYNKDAISSDKDLNLRINQIKVSEKFFNHGIKVILPLKITDTYFSKINDIHFLIYPYKKNTITSKGNITKNHIITLATTLASINKINYKTNLKTSYKRIDINLKTYLKLYKNSNNEMYNFIKKYYKKINHLIKLCNKSIKKASKELCLSHNDYKLKNMLWQNDDLYLIDFDACGYVNPLAALIESAYSLCLNEKKLDKEKYQLFISTYLQLYSPLSSPKNVVYAAMNGKLQWLSYILNTNKYEDIKSLIIELNNFYTQTNTILEPFKN